MTEVKSVVSVYDETYKEYSIQFTSDDHKVLKAITLSLEEVELLARHVPLILLQDPNTTPVIWTRSEDS